MTSLVKEIDKLASGNKKAFVVLLTDDKEAAKGKLEKIAKDGSVKNVPLCVNADGAKAPAAYKVNEKVKHTVLVYKGKKVTANFALDAISKGDVEAIAKAAKEVYGG